MPNGACPVRILFPKKKTPTLLTLGILFYSILCPTSQLKAAYHTLRGDAIDLSNPGPPFPLPPFPAGRGVQLPKSPLPLIQ